MNIALEKTERKKSSNAINKNERENLSTCCNISGQNSINAMKLAEENVNASLLKKVLNLLALNCCKWSVHGLVKLISIIA